MCVCECFNVFETIVNMRNFSFRFSREERQLERPSHTAQLCSVRRKGLRQNTFQDGLTRCQCPVATKAKCPKAESNEMKANPFLSLSWQGKLFDAFPNPLESRTSGLTGATLFLHAFFLVIIKQDAKER